MKKGGGYPYLLVLKTADGRLVWGKRLDNHTAAMLTQSPTVHDGYIYQGVSSLEELSAADPKYACCTFRGSMLKVRLSDGAIMWRTFMAPDNKNKPGGFSGNSVWGSSPSVDVLRKQVGGWGCRSLLRCAIHVMQVSLVGRRTSLCWPGQHNKACV